jgi:hypothetical protein
MTPTATAIVAATGISRGTMAMDRTAPKKPFALAIRMIGRRPLPSCSRSSPLLTRATRFRPLMSSAYLFFSTIKISHVADPMFSKECDWTGSCRNTCPIPVPS